jgi:hypothetical protein
MHFFISAFLSMSAVSKRFLLLCLLVPVGSAASPQTPPVEKRVANFSEDDLSGWEEKSFKGNSQYSFVDAASIDGGNHSEVAEKVLQASTQGQASGLFKEVAIDLNKTPYLHWTWRVNTLFSDNDERSKAGDDYPARIYVVVSGGVFFWKTKAVNYVWSSQQSAGSEWPNAYTGSAKMIAVQGGGEKLGQWVSQRVNVREDLQRLFGDDLSHIDAVAVMVDGDNTGQSATSYFGDIFFSDQ